MNFELGIWKMEIERGEVVGKENFQGKERFFMKREKFLRLKLLEKKMLELIIV